MLHPSQTAEQAAHCASATMASACNALTNKARPSHNQPSRSRTLQGRRSVQLPCPAPRQPGPPAPRPPPATCCSAPPPSHAEPRRTCRAAPLPRALPHRAAPAFTWAHVTSQERTSFHPRPIYCVLELADFVDWQPAYACFNASLHGSTRISSAWIDTDILDCSSKPRSAPGAWTTSPLWTVSEGPDLPAAGQEHDGSATYWATGICDYDAKHKR